MCTTVVYMYFPKYNIPINITQLIGKTKQHSVFSKNFRSVLTAYITSYIWQMKPFFNSSSQRLKSLQFDQRIHCLCTISAATHKALAELWPPAPRAKDSLCWNEGFVIPGCMSINCWNLIHRFVLWPPHSSWASKCALSMKSISIGLQYVEVLWNSLWNICV